MAESASNEGINDAPTRDEEQPATATFTLSIVSPSTEVASPLTFSNLLVSTTVQGLKAKIRDVVPSKPDDSSQRLIHRGRMLADSQTMLQVFGQESLSTSDPHTIHLVLRPPLPDATPDASTTNPGTNAQQRTLTPPAFPAIRARTPPVINQVGIAHPPDIAQGVQTQQELPGGQPHGQPHHDLHHAESTHNVMTQRLHQLQRETARLQQEIEAGARAYHLQLGRIMNNLGHQPHPNPTVTRNPLQPTNGRTSLQQLILEQQQRRGAEGRQGAQEMARNPPFVEGLSPGRLTPNFHNPNHSTTYTREGVGPNGERWQVTVNETTTTVPISHLTQRNNHNSASAAQAGTNPAADLQQMLRNMDRLVAGQNQPNGARRASSNPPSARTRTPVSSSLPTPTAGATSIPRSPASAVLLNPVANASAPSLVTNLTTSSNNMPRPAVEPMVYILTSPSGPRALLINNSESFYTPRLTRYRQSNGPAQVNGQPREPPGFAEYRNRNAQRGGRRGGRPRPNEEVPVNFAQVHNREARPGVPFALRLFNMIWLVVRLIGFVWFFTSGNNSWSRLLMMTGLAIVVFIVNMGFFTGAFNSIAEQVLGPIRRHLENLIPLAGPDAALVPAANAVVVPQNAAAETGDRARVRRGELDEAEVAARLIEQRRQANTGWIATQIRRAEHAALLFIASLVPGVGERHIAARDNAAREAEAAAAEAERRRVEAENEAENEANGGNSENPEAGGAEQPAGTGENAEVTHSEEANPDPQREAPAAPPLIAA
ncbi:ubiquitin family protein [Rutstroemia sp. NJR-2017a WRK4]|nr:ubiquitin family protein [Rutstroemia sp. NJR-2017a WRK4]